VLARLPDAPKGVKGISLFLVPKYLPDADGPSVRNGAKCTAIEHKMGLKASATCQMLFEDAKGWLVGEPHRGLEAMFTMMNAERVGVGIQGLGIGEAAYQSAVWYARTVSGPLAVGRQASRQAGRSDHRPPRRAPHAADHARVERRLPWRVGLGGPRARCGKARSRSSASVPPILSR
jgi:alkylation response protein AidB-like acyl-CoA dehydrogenase